MDIFFVVTFLASEYRTTDGGCMDNIGIDENNCPVIFEYKRSINVEQGETIPLTECITRINIVHLK